MFQPRFLPRLALAVVASAVMAAPAVPQQVLTQKVLSADVALAVAQGALEKCRADGYRVTIAVIDTNNLMKLFVRDDGSGIVSFDLARRKAFTALAFKRNSSEQVKIWRAAQQPVYVPPEAAAGAGGVPIRVGDEVIGAVGISGAPNGDLDEACALAGIAKVADKLK
jgi:uncharacterized protein GlcG (DUF336 family)